jgi:hypothetical protein
MPQICKKHDLLPQVPSPLYFCSVLPPSNLYCKYYELCKNDDCGLIRLPFISLYSSTPEKFKKTKFDKK